MFFRSRPAPPATPHTLPPTPDTVRPRSSSHAQSTARPASYSRTQPHINTSASAILPSPSQLVRRDSAASPSSRQQPTPQLLHRSATSTSPFTSFTPVSTSPSLSPAPSSQQQLLLNSSFSLSNTTSSSHTSTSQPAAAAGHYSYHHFSQKMKDPLAAPLVKRLKAIVTSVTSRPPPANDALAATSRDVHSQLHALTSALPQHPLFARVGRDELSNAAESMEKFVLSKLHATLYYPSNPASPLLQRSRAFYAKCRALSWLHGRHLELPPSKQEAAVWREAGLELRRMAEYKAPKDKLVCLLNACHLVHHSLLGRADGGCGEAGVGADDIFPAFIFTLLHAHPRHFLLDLRWVSCGRYPEAMKGECEYWVTMAESAIVFIERCNEQSIKVEREGEWDSELIRARNGRDEERQRRKEASASGLSRLSGGSSVGGDAGSGGKVEEEKRVAEEDERGGARSDSDRDSEVGAAGSRAARLSGTTNSSLSADDSADGRRLALHTDDDLNASTSSSSSHLSTYTPNTVSPEHSPLSSTTPLPSPLLRPSHSPSPSSSPSMPAMTLLSPTAAAGVVGGEAVVLSGGLSLSYVGAAACELGATDVVRLLQEYQEMAAIIRMWSAKPAS